MTLFLYILVGVYAADMLYCLYNGFGSNQNLQSKDNFLTYIVILFVALAIYGLVSLVYL